MVSRDILLAASVEFKNSSHSCCCCLAPRKFLFLPYFTAKKEKIRKGKKKTEWRM